MTKNETPAARAARMDAMPTHVVYMTRGGGNALITQTYCEVISDLPDRLVVESVSGTTTIPIADVFARKDGRLSQAEMDAVFETHGHAQKRA